MKTTVKAFLHWEKRDWEENGRYVFYPDDWSVCGPEYVPINEIEIEVDVPDDFDPTPQQIAALKAKKQEILANAHVQAENIEEQIQRLLCIEFKPEAA